MYSRAFAYYIKYLQSINECNENNQIQDSKKELFKLKEQGNTNYDLNSIIDIPKVKPKFEIINNSKMWARNQEYASNNIAAYNYLCEYNTEHNHFTSKFNGKNYVESHHLIPMKYQDDFSNSIDIYSNLVSLCLVCHKKLHYASLEEIQEILDSLFKKRKHRLEKSGIILSLEDLYKYYKS